MPYNPDEVNPLLDTYGDSTTARANVCLVLCLEEEPEGLEEWERWPSPMEKAHQLARWVGPEPEILTRALEMVRTEIAGGGPLVVERGALPSHNWARALVILTEAQRLRGDR